MQVTQALRGLQVVTPEVEEFISSIYFESVPSQWRAVSYLTSKSLGLYIDDLLERVAFINDWIMNDAEPHPKIFWIGAFFHPRKLLTGMLCYR